MVQPVYSSSCPINTVDCAKSAKKNCQFSWKNTVKTLLGFWYFCDISFVLTPVVAHKILFRRGKYALQDGRIFKTIQRSKQKVNFSTTPNWGFGWIFGLVRPRDPLRLTSALLVPGGMQPILLGWTRPGVDRRHWGVRIPHDRWVAHARGWWTVGRKSGLELMNQRRTALVIILFL